MYDLTVIGAGPGGYCCAIRAAQLGASVAVVEKDKVGGTCLNRGCVPTKALLESAEKYHSLADLGQFGLSADRIAYDWDAVLSRKERISAQLRGGVEALLKRNGITVVRGNAQLLDAQRVQVTSEKETAVLESKYIVIATGSKTAEIPIPGRELPGVITSDEALLLKELPGTMAVVGGGVIGTELATVYALFGTKVTILELTEDILPMVDADVTGVLKKCFADHSVEVVTSARVEKIVHSGGRLEVCYTKENRSASLCVDSVLLAMGRSPNTDGLGAEKIGIEKEKRRIKVDSGFQTSVPGVFAIGDAASRIQLAHVAMAEGKRLAENLFAGKRQEMDYLAIPTCIYTYPEIACVGLTEKQAREHGYDAAVGRFSLAANGRTLTMGEKNGFVKIIAEKKHGAILGAELIGPHVTEMVGELAFAISMETTLDELTAAVHPHPTISESIGEAAEDVLGVCVHQMPGKQKGER